MDLAVHYRCLEKCYDGVRALDLPGLPVGRVLLRKLPTDRLLDNRENIPCVVVSLPADAVEAYELGTNDRDDVSYPVLITFIQASNQDIAAGQELAHFLTWRERVSRKFRNQRLDGVPEVFYCRLELRPIIEPDLFFDKNLDVGGILLRFVSREPRGM